MATAEQGAETPPEAARFVELFRKLWAEPNPERFAELFHPDGGFRHPGGQTVTRDAKRKRG